MKLYEPGIPLWEKIRPDEEGEMPETIPEWRYRSVVHYMKTKYKDFLEKQIIAAVAAGEVNAKDE